MKITHINTFSTGGAANAAIRLHKGLLKDGVDSRMIFLRDCPAGLDNADAFIKKEPVPLSVRVRRKLTGKRSIEHKLNKEAAKRAGHYETISFPLSSYRVEDHPWVQEADIIHLHWVSKFINYPSFFKKITKSLVWTLHDMNPIRGIFHYQDDVIANKEKFGSLEQAYANMKKNILSTVNSLSVVTPSSWLGGLSSQSEILGGFTHQVIPNGLDMELFRSYDQILARQVFNLPPDKKIFLFVSEGLKNRRKGFDLLLESFKSLEDRQDAAVCAVGKLNRDTDIKNIFFTGPIYDDRLMALLYSAADAFVLPSREDNLPNVMLESLGCGTPVISFPIGGMKETIIPLFNGLIAKDLSAASLREELTRFLTQSEYFDRQQIRRFAVEKFSLQKQAAAYIQLYEKILSDQEIKDHVR